MRLLACLSLAVALIGATLSTAHAASPAPLDLGEGTPVVLATAPAQPFWRLTTVMSEPGETQDAFLLRVAAALSTFSFNRRVEACGFLWVSATGDRWAVPLGTINAHTTCLFQTSGPADDSGTAWVNTNLTIHSHPRDRTVNERELSRDDLKVAGYLVAGRRLTYHAAGSRDQRVIGDF